MSQNYTYTTSQSNNLHITTYGNANLELGNCIIFVHGFKGFKDWGFGPYLGEKLASKGNFVITFNFSHNGVGENSSEFTELDKFANNTYSIEIEEIEEIVKAYQNGFFGKINNNSKIGLLGHSRGGGDVLIAGSSLSSINTVVTWSAISNFDRFTDRQKTEWRNKGYLEMLNTRTKQVMKLNKTLLDDIELNNSSKLNIKSAVNKLNKPLLIVHGDQDLAVKIKEAEEIYSWSDKSLTEFFKISGTGHTFDIKHPFEGTTEVFEKVLERTNYFFNKHLNETH